MNSKSPEEKDGFSTATDSEWILIRADASGDRGVGHIMRMMALAQAWKLRGGNVLIVSVECHASLAERLESESIRQVFISETLGGDGDAKATLELAEKHNCSWVVLDGYDFDIQYQRQFADSPFRLLVVDDFGYEDEWCADAILNQNVFADQWNYQLENPGSQQLLGPKFALLRQEFLEESQADFAANEKNSGSESENRSLRLLITLGGGDANNVTERLLDLLDPIDRVQLDIRLVIGGANPHRAQLENRIKQSPHGIELCVDVLDMPGIIREADAVISAAGSTCWEWLYYRKPGAVVQIAENQVPIAQALGERSLAVDLGWYQQLAAKKEQLEAFLTDVQCAREGQVSNPKVPQGNPIDGLGASRVCALLARRLKISFLTAAEGWLKNRIQQLAQELTSRGHLVSIIDDINQIEPGDILFLLSVWDVVPANQLKKNVHNLVVHASDLPKGRGWSPTTWGILEGKNSMPVCLLEASQKVDRGPVYLRDKIELEGHELIEEIRQAVTEATFRLCRDFIVGYPEIAGKAKPQVGEPSYLERRTPADSELDPQRSIADQFNLLRVVDNLSYPAFFHYLGHQYRIQITKMNPDDLESD